MSILRSLRVAENFASAQLAEHAPGPDYPVAEEKWFHNVLVRLGGRPSHPIEELQSIVHSPGKHRDILSYWQEHPEQWRVFGAQGEAWAKFIMFQKEKRAETAVFDAYVQEVDARLARNGFPAPATFASAAAAFDRDWWRQGRLETWIEYVHWLYCTREPLESRRRHHAYTLESRMRQIQDSGNLGQFGEHNVQQLRLMLDPNSPANIWRKMESVLFLREYLEEQREVFWRTGCRRTHILKCFHRDTEKYYSARAAADKHQLLVDWALQQLLQVEAETRGAAMASAVPAPVPAPAPAPDPAPKTWGLDQLPIEIQNQIWLQCLPDPGSPSTHFFDIVNHPRAPQPPRTPRHWSKVDFAVRPSAVRDSGYRAVCKMLATSRASRAIAAGWIRHHSGNGPDGAWGGPENPFGNFESFDWIPADDLIVLCFPPREARLPLSDALSFRTGPARHVAVMVSAEMALQSRIDHHTSLRPPFSKSVLESWKGGPSDWLFLGEIPALLEALRSRDRMDSTLQTLGGIKAVHIIVEGFKGKAVVDSRAWMSPNRPERSWDLYLDGRERAARHARRVILHLAPWEWNEAGIQGHDDKSKLLPRWPFGSATREVLIPFRMGQGHVVASGDLALVTENVTDFLQKELQQRKWPELEMVTVLGQTLMAEETGTRQG